MTPVASDLAYDDISIGSVYSVERTFTREDVLRFAELSGDFSPLHVDTEYAATTEFGHCVVHGMLLGALCSQIVGMQVPGRRALYLGQDLTFRRPVPVGETVRAFAKVTAKNDATRVVVLQTEIRGADDRIVASGPARVKVREPSRAGLSAGGTSATQVTGRGAVALVTGASRGIGAEIARVLAGRGWAVAVNYWRSADAAATVVDDIASAGGSAFAVQGDIRDEASVEKITAEVTARLGAPLLLVNAATGELEQCPASELTWAAFEHHLSYQVRGVLRMCQAVLPGMIAAGRGSIVNMLSQATGNVPPAQLADYVTAKYALMGLSKALAAEWADRNIRVNMVSPGLTRTELTQAYPERVFKLEAARTPMRRLATARDAAAAVAFLASEDAGFLTGVNLFVSGGQIMQ